MEKIGIKSRKIKFFSKKNNTTIFVHSREAKNYAEQLESNSEVLKYETLKELNVELYNHINPIDIRKSYFELSWTTDFIIYYKDGTKGIREFIKKEYLFKRAQIEKLEFSRRYWTSLGVNNWKVLLMEDDKKCFMK